MKRKQVDLKKLSIDVTTIRILSDAEQKRVLGGAPNGDPPWGGPSKSCGVCSREPGTC